MSVSHTTLVCILLGFPIASAGNAREKVVVMNLAGAQVGLVGDEARAVVAADPAFIILGDARYGVSPESIAQRPGWENLSAVKNGQVLPFNDDLVTRPGPRLVDVLEELAKLLRPELFQ